MKKYIAHYENEEGYDWIETLLVEEGSNPFEVAYSEAPNGYSLVFISEDKEIS